jgi:D-lactate dehydrogenase (cytochrome)
MVVTEKDCDLVCQAGATWDDINHTLEEKGINLFFPVSWLRLQPF